MPLSVEKYVNGEWYDISGNFSMNSSYAEIFNVPAGEEKAEPLHLCDELS